MPALGKCLTASHQVSKRYQMAQLMKFESYAAYNLKPKMAKNPETVWFNPGAESLEIDSLENPYATRNK